MKKIHLFVAAFAAVLSAHASVYTVMDAPGASEPANSSSLTLLGADDSQAVGTYTDSNNVVHTFMATPTQYLFFAPQGKTNITVTGYQSGAIYGTYQSSSSVGSGNQTPFAYEGGIFYDINPPGVASSLSLLGVASFGVVGTYINSNNQVVNFSFDGQTYSTIKFGNPSYGTNSITAVGTNAVFGSYLSGSTNLSFVYNGSTYSTFTNIVTPVGLLGSNIAGNTSGGSVILAGTKITGEGFPKASSSTLIGTLYSGLVGNYSSASGSHGYFVNGSVKSSFDSRDPNAQSGTTQFLSSCQDTVVGSFQDAQGTDIPFVYRTIGSSYETFATPPSGTIVLGIAGTKAYGTSTDVYGNTNSFTFDSATTNFTTFTVPFSDSASIAGITTNLVVGNYIDSNLTQHGFIYDGVNYQSVDSPDPNAVDGSTTLYQITTDGIVFGSYTNNANFNQEYFLLSSSNPLFLYGPQTNGNGIAQAVVTTGGLVAGSFSDATTGTPLGFFYKNGTYSIFHAPSGGIDDVVGITGNLVAGNYTDSNNVSHGFLWNYSTHAFTPINRTGADPGSTSLIAAGTSTFVGSCTINGTNAPFLLSGSSFSSIVPPGSVSGGTVVAGISGNKPFGLFTDQFGLSHGFGTIGGLPPAPVTSANGGTVSASTVVRFPSLNPVGMSASYSVVSGPGVIASNSLSFTGAGTVTVLEQVGGNSVYSGTSTALTYVSTLMPQTIASWPVIKSIPYSLTPVTIKLPLASSKLLPTYTVSGPASLAGNHLTVSGTGTVTLTATQAGNSIYSAAPARSISFPVVRAATAISAFHSLPSVSFSTTKIVTFTPPTTSSGLPVSLSATGATLIGNTLTLDGPGTVTITASFGGNVDYLPAASVSTRFVVKP